MEKRRVLIIFYSYTQQTRLLVKQLADGLSSEGVAVTMQRIQPVQPYEIPLRSNLRLLTVMVQTFFRRHMPVLPPVESCYQQWDRIVLAGPTWSYHPSGPVLCFLDIYGEKLFRGMKVVPLISCRSYWRIHYVTLKRILRRCHAEVEAPIVFTHPIREPWRIIGLMLQLRGKMVRRENSWFRKHYPEYGHSREQGVQAYEKGRELGRQLMEDPEGPFTATVR